jgi:hypothetical protein
MMHEKELLDEAYALLGRIVEEPWAAETRKVREEINNWQTQYFSWLNRQTANSHIKETDSYEPRTLLEEVMVPSKTVDTIIHRDIPSEIEEEE